MKGAWVGDTSTAAIKIKTLLGEKYLALDPQGTKQQDPATADPAVPHDLAVRRDEAFNGLGQDGRPDRHRQLARKLRGHRRRVLRQHPAGRPHSALTASPSLSQTIASRDNQLGPAARQHQARHRRAGREDTQFAELLGDGNLLLGELRQRRRRSRAADRHRGSWPPSSGLVTDNQNSLGPALNELNRVTNVLQANQATSTRHCAWPARTTGCSATRSATAAGSTPTCAACCPATTCRPAPTRPSRLRPAPAGPGPAMMPRPELERSVRGRACRRCSVLVLIVARRVGLAVSATSAPRARSRPTSPRRSACTPARTCASWASRSARSTRSSRRAARSRST